MNYNILLGIFITVSIATLIFWINYILGVVDINVPLYGNAIQLILILMMRYINKVESNESN